MIFEAGHRQSGAGGHQIRSPEDSGRDRQGDRFSRQGTGDVPGRVAHHHGLRR